MIGVSLLSFSGEGVRCIWSKADYHPSSTPPAVRRTADDRLVVSLHQLLRPLHTVLKKTSDHPRALTLAA